MNDVGYTMYLIKNLRKEEALGICMAEGHSKDSLLSFVNYALSFAEILSLLNYEAGGVGVVASSSEDEQLVGFGSQAKILDNRVDGYADFAMGRILDVLVKYFNQSLICTASVRTRHDNNNRP